MHRYFFQMLLILATAGLWASCDKKDNDTKTEDTFKLSGNAAGANERPNPVTTNASGTITGTYSKEDKMLHYTINWTGLSGAPLAMHFHGPASPDSAAGVAKPITGFPVAVDGSVSGMEMLTAEQEAQLLGGLWYYNIHTDANKGGEIRGNITAKAD